MDVLDFKKDFLSEVKASAAAIGEGSSAAFADHMAQYLIDAEVLPDFTPSFYTGKYGRNKCRVDGYVYNELDQTMNLVFVDYNGNDTERRLKPAAASHDFGQLAFFLKAAFQTNLYKEIEMSTPCSDLIDFLRVNEKNIRKYRFFIFTDADMSSALKNIETEPYDGIPTEGQIWDIDRLYRVCCSDQGRQVIEIDFREYGIDGIPCLEASSAATDQYRSYLGVISGSVLADIYDKYGARLLEGNVRSFLSTKVAVNKKIRGTILNSPQMFFAFNNGISATAMEVTVEDTECGRLITAVKDFQIINGGQTTASVFNTRLKDKAPLDKLYVQIKLTEVGGSTQEETDDLIRSISRTSNSQNKVSDADFFASHPFHRRMEAISRRLLAPAVGGAQYETKWFYERARGQYLQEQMKLTQAQKNKFLLQHPKKQLIKKTDLAKVQNTWSGHPDIVSKGAQTNFISFAEYIDEQWTINDAQFNERYFQNTAALLLLFQFLESSVSKQAWYQGGYRANIVYYTAALFRFLLQRQFSGADLNLALIWNRQQVPAPVGRTLISLAELVHLKITSTERGLANVTQWCKKKACWEAVKKIDYVLPGELEAFLVSPEDKKAEQRSANKEQKVDNGISAQAEVVHYSGSMWTRLREFAVKNNMVTAVDITALSIAEKIPTKIPNAYQSKRLVALLHTAAEEGFNIKE